MTACVELLAGKLMKLKMEIELGVRDRCGLASRDGEAVRWIAIELQRSTMVLKRATAMA